MYRFEDQNVEFKQEYVEDIRKEAIAFANTEGGTIFVGVQKDGETVGVADPDDTMLRIANSLKDSIAPDIMPFVDIKAVDVDGLKVIEITVRTGTNRPYYIRKNGLRPSGVYVRKGSSSQPMTDEGIREMIRETSGTSYEEGRSLFQDLTFETLKNEMDLRDLPFGLPQMQTLHLVGTDGLFTNLAYLLSDQCPSFCKIALFQGKDKEVFRDRQEFTGSLLKQMEDAYAYIDKANKTSATFSRLLRNDSRDYPTEALREALLNSFCHRDYAVSASNIINIYDDRIEFVSMGGLVPGITLDSLYLGISSPRNKYLAALYYRMHLIESYGTGIGKIRRAYRDQERKPLFETAPGVFRVTLPNVYEAAAEGNKENEQKQTKQQPVITSVSKQNALRREKQLIIQYVEENGRVTRQNVEEMLEIGTTKAFRLLKELCEEGVLQIQGSGKGVHYILGARHH